MIFIDVTWSHDDDIALAVSGGVDSNVLLHLLITKYQHTFKTLTLLHVNHQQRVESIEEESYIRDYASRHGLKLYVKHLEFEDDSFSQSKARELRYAFFMDVMAGKGIEHLLTAHHLDDDYETIALQLFSGRTPIGIAPSRQMDDITIHRPLIHMRKDTLYTYAEKHHVRYFEDVTNREDNYTRNFMRNQILSKIDGHPHLSVSSLSEIRDDYQAIEAVLAKHFAHITDSISRRTFVNLTELEQIFVLRKLSGDTSLSRKYAKEIANVANDDTSNAAFVVSEETIVIAYDSIYVKDKRASDTALEITASGRHKFNDYIIDVDASILPIHVRTQEPGDKIPLDFGTKKVARIFIDAKVPTEKRNHIPIITNTLGKIIAVGVMYNIIDRDLLNIERMTIDDTEK